MPLDLYGPCPCGSGKKFKWCCQPIHVQIDKAFRLDEEGQHEAASRIMDEVTAENPANPEAWGRKAQLLYQNDRVNDAEETLQKALDINPKYPFGHLLRGLFRQHEGEIAGALLLFRAAADLYDPEAKDVLAQVYSLIADCEMKLQHPVAAHAALATCMRLRPNEEVRKAIEMLFGTDSRLPASVRIAYTFLSPSPGSSSERRHTWDQALAGAATGKLSDAARAFEQLTNADANDAAAWYNLGLVRAWLGNNREAIDALDHYVSLEPNENQAGAAWALAEGLRFGQGMEDQADYVEHSAMFQVREPQKISNLLQELQRERRLIGVQVDEQQGVLTGIVTDQTGLVTAGACAGMTPHLGAYLMIIGDLFRLWSVSSESLDRVRRDLQQRVGPALSDARMQRGPANFGDIVSEALVFPIGVTDRAEAEKLVREYVQRYFEDRWIHRPLKSLNNVAPIDAAGHTDLRKKLRGVIQFLEECVTTGAQAYDFIQLRRKLGLDGGTPAASSVSEMASIDINAMGTAELAGLDAEKLTDDQVEDAYRTAQKLDAHELASHFARLLVARPARADRTDRFPWYNYLVQRALVEGNADLALGYVDEGEKADCEQNEGRRRNDYELRRGQVLSKQGDFAAARVVFERLIERVPSELRYRGTAAESMLAGKQGAAALQFAEHGLAAARQQNNRDSEEYFQELASAARKQA
jgi:tetratricopeptide (TPR) repeat protein